MGVHSEAAAYETLKKLTQSRKATEFITSLIMQYLVDEATVKKQNPVVDSPMTIPKQADTASLPKKPGEGQPIAQGKVAHSDTSSPLEEKNTIPDVQPTIPPAAEKQEMETDAGVSMKGIEDAMAIFGY